MKAAASRGNLPESSVLSKSLSCAADLKNLNEIVLGKTSKIDCLFPLVEDLLRDCSIPEFLYYILTLYFGIQIIASSFWPALEYSLKDDDDFGRSMNVFFEIAFMAKYESDSASLTLSFIIIVVLALITIICLLIQAILFSIHRQFIKWTLYPTKIIIEFIPLLLLMPTSNYIGKLFVVVVYQTTTQSIVYFVFSILIFAFMMFVQYIQSFFFCSSPFIPSSCISCWNGKFQYTIYCGMPFFLVLQYVIQIFGRWIDYLCIALLMLFNIFLVYECFKFPYVKKKLSILIAILFSSVTVIDITVFILAFDIHIHIKYQLIAFVGALLLSTSILYPLMNKRYKKMAKNLTYKQICNANIDDINDNGTPENNKNFFSSQPKIRSYYHYLGLNSNKSLCETYLRIGLAERSELFLNWSLIKFIAEYHDDRHMTLLITQFICFFPCESRMLKYLFMLSCSKVGLRYHERFLLFSIHRVMDLRQSSASNEITTKLLDLKHYSLKGINATRDFWNNVPPNPDIYYQIYRYCSRGKAFFNEAILKWPNNSKFAEDYSKFLVECGTDFVNGVVMKNRANLIDQGKNFVVDHSFKSLVRNYPYYLKRGVMDIRGNFINKDGASNSRSSSINNNSSISTGTIDGQMDAEIEEEIARVLFSFHRLRIAFQRAVENKKSKNSMFLKASAFFSTVFLLCLCIFFVIYFSNIFDERIMNIKTQRALVDMRYGLDTSITAVVIYWARKLGFIGNELYALMQEKTNNKYSLDINEGKLLSEACNWINFGRSKLELFIQSMIDFAGNGANIMEYSDSFFSAQTDYYFCENNNKYDQPIQASLKNVFTFEFLRLREITIENNGIQPDAVDWYNSENLCEVIVNLAKIFEKFDFLLVKLSERQNSIKQEITTKDMNILIGCIVAYACTTTPFLILFLYRYYFELKGLLDLMRSLDPDVQKDASRPFKEDNINDSEQESMGDVLSQGGLNIYIVLAVIIISLLVGVGILIAIVFLTERENQNFVNINNWLDDGLSRGTHIMEILYQCTLLIMMGNNLISTNFSSVSQAQVRLKSSMDNLINENDRLLHGANGSKPCIGVNAEFDQLNLHENCISESDKSNSMHDNYGCTSIDKGISFLTSMAGVIHTTPSAYQLEPNSTYYHMFHLINIHLIDPCFVSADLLTNNADVAVGEFQVTLFIICICGVFYAIIAMICAYTLFMKFDDAFKGALQLFRRIPPLSIVSNHELMEFLMNKKSDKSLNKMTASQSIIMMSQNCVLCLNRNETIEIINAAVTTLFGYTPEQLLGQPVNCILTEDTDETLYQHMTLMKQGQCSLIYDTHAFGISDDDQKIPVNVTILGIPFLDEDSYEAASFAVIIRDETLLVKNRQEAEDAKKQSETLLYQILPRDIVTRLNQGETDISFTVPSASIIFIDIVKWSEYSLTLSPSQIMSNLSLIFAKFDQYSSKYPLLTKIKLIGDVYMAAAGLFTPEENPSSHAHQMIQFALDCLTAVEESNTALDSSLQVRIGINTDGPLIAGVLGTDKPVFDIIGDPINVASRLQSMCIPSTIQISQSTYNLVAEMNFNIEKRGEIELKGKGKKMAYIVRPTQNSSFIFMQSDKEVTSVDSNLVLFQ